MIQRLLEFFREPATPYQKEDPKFRAVLAEVESASLLEKLRLHLEKRYGLRINSLATTVLLLSVVLTSAYVFFDTIADTLISVEAWARPLFLPALWSAIAMIYFLVQAVKSPKDEIHPNPQYTGDEIKQAVEAALGVDNLASLTGKDAAPLDIPDAKLVLAQLTEAASRTNHDRVALRNKRDYKNRGLAAAMVTLVLFGLALTIYAVVSPFV